MEVDSTPLEAPAEESDAEVSDASDFVDDENTATNKRKAEDFIQQTQKSIDVSFQPSVTLPGDNVTDKVTVITNKLKLGPGLVQRGPSVIATRGGMLRYKPPCTYWVDNNQKRYIPRAEDQVVGVIEDRVGGELYRINIFGSSAALMPLFSFDGATKRNHPNLRIGTLVYARVVSANKHMEPELTCTVPNHALKKDWMTGQSTFGELKGGLMMRCSLMLARSLMKPTSVVLNHLGRHLPFEIAVGVNGAFWVHSGCPEHTIIIANAILNSEVMDDQQTVAMVDRLLAQSQRSM